MSDESNMRTMGQIVGDQAGAGDTIGAEIARFTTEAGKELATKAELRLFLAAEKMERQSPGTGDIVVVLPEYGNPTFEPDLGRSTQEMLAFKINLRPTGRLIRYTIPRAVYRLWKAVWSQE